MPYRDSVHLRAWFWVIKEGHVGEDDWQPWAFEMIERMDHPPAWICDMATITDGREMYLRLKDHLDAWKHSEVYTQLGDLEIGLEYLAYRRGETSLAELLERAASTPQEMLIGKPEEFKSVSADYRRAVTEGQPLESVEARTLELFARCFPQAHMFWSMTHDPADQVARDIVEAEKAWGAAGAKNTSDAHTSALRRPLVFITDWQETI